MELWHLLSILDTVELLVLKSISQRSVHDWFWCDLLPSMTSAFPFPRTLTLVINTGVHRSTGLG